MRKFLSLVLALVMTMSLVTISAGAKEFTDADSINYDEAVDVISALGVVDGYAGGEFGPSGILTRQAAAKIICNLVLGPTTARALSADAAPFPDVPAGGEFAGYIAYCSNQGIIGGYPDGTFRPGGSLTGYAFMKMLLGALGYDASIEGFGGSNWTINVGKLAVGNGLDDGLTDGFDGSKAVTREEAALYALNTLTATMVDYGQRIYVTDANGVQQPIGYYDAKEVQNNLQKNNQETIDNDGLLQFGERYFDDLKLNDTAKDDFGRPSNEWTLKSTKIGTYGKTSDLVASYTAKVSKGNIYDVLSSAVRNDLENTADSAKANAKLTVTVDGSTVSSGNIGGYATAKVASGSTQWYQRNSSEAIYTFNGSGSSRNGTLTEVYVNDDNAVDIVIINTYVYQATSDYSSSRDDVRMAPVGDTRLNLKAGELTLKGEDFNIADVKTDDYLLVTAATAPGSTTGYEVQTVTVAEKVQGQVSGYTNGENVTIDGTTYKYNATTLNSGSGVRTTEYTVGQDAIVVLDHYGNIIAVDEAQASSSYVFIEEIDGSSGLNTKAVANAYFTDGTNEEITLDRVTSGGETYKSASTIIATGSLEKQWYTYSINGDGKYVLYAPGSNRVNQDDTYTLNHVSNGAPRPTYQPAYNGRVDYLTSAASFSGGTHTGDDAALVTDKTIMVINDRDGDVVTYTGASSLPDITLTAPEDPAAGPAAADLVVTFYYLNNSDGYTEYIFVDLEGTGASVVDGGDDTSFMYVLRFKDTLNAANATQYFTYSTVNPEDGTEEVTKFDARQSKGADEHVYLPTSGSNPNQHPYQLYYKPRYNSDEEISNLTAVPNEVGSGKYFNHAIGGDQLLSFNNNALTIGNDRFTVAGDSQINLVIVKSDSTRRFLDNKGADHEVYFNTQGNTIESLLKGFKLTGEIAGCTKSSSSRAIDTIYITVKSAAVDAGVGTPGAYNDITDLAADAVGWTNADMTTPLSVPSGYTLSVGSSNTAVVDVQYDSGKVQVKPVSVGGPVTITVTLTRDSDGEVAGEARFKVTVVAAKTDAEKLSDTKTALTTGLTGAALNLPATVDDATKAKEAVLAKAAAITGVSDDVTIDTDGAGAWTPATAATDATHPGADAQYVVTLKLTIGTEGAQTVGPLTFKVPDTAIAWADTNGGKAEAATDMIDDAVTADATLGGAATPNTSDASFATDWADANAAYTQVANAIADILVDENGDALPYESIDVIMIDATGDTSEGAWSSSYTAPSSGDPVIFLVTITYGNGTTTGTPATSTIEVTFTFA